MESQATVKRPTVGRDTASGVTSDPFVVVKGPIPCSVNQAGASVILLYAQRNTSVSATMYFAQDPCAQVNDIIEIKDMHDCYTNVAATYLVKGKVQSVPRYRMWQVDVEFIEAPYLGCPSSGC